MEMASLLPNKILKNKESSAIFNITPSISESFRSLGKILNVSAIV